MTFPSKVAVLGLDGVPFSLLSKLFDTGVTPCLAELAAKGSFLRMKTSLPPVSSVAWTSFMTGANPGEHGIYGFTDLKPGEAAVRLPSFDDVKKPPIWNLVPGATSVVVNLPFTYPARPLNGILISGFVAPALDRAVYPPSLLPWLKSRNYRIDVDTVKGREDRDFLIRDIFETFSLHEEVMAALMAARAWDLFVGVVTQTDRLSHFFFDAFEDPRHPRNGDCVEFFRRVDRFVGRFAQGLGPGVRLIILSDHGFTELKTQVYLNHILASLGYLSFSRPSPRSLEDMDPRSRAFAMDPTRIHLHTKDRFRNGPVAAAEAGELRGRLKNDLERLRLRDVGITDHAGDEPLFERVLFREEAYGREAVGMAPDLVVVARRGYDVKAAVNAPGPVFRDIFTGMHTEDDAFLLVDDASVAERLPEPEISQVASLIMDVLKPGLVTAAASGIVSGSGQTC